MIKIYSEYLQLKNFIAVKDAVKENLLKMFSLALNTLIPSFLPVSEAVQEVLACALQGVMVYF